MTINVKISQNTFTQRIMYGNIRKKRRGYYENIFNKCLAIVLTVLLTCLSLSNIAYAKENNPTPYNVIADPKEDAYEYTDGFVIQYKPKTESSGTLTYYYTDFI